MTAQMRLQDIEDIKVLKARYFYYLDHKDWDGWRSKVFTRDCRVNVSEVQAESFVGIDAFIQLVSNVLSGAVSIHHGHMPDIQVTTDDRGIGVWAMEDLVYFPKERPFQGRYTCLHGWGHYRETYARTSVGWRIDTMNLTRLRLELT